MPAVDEPAPIPPQIVRIVIRPAALTLDIDQEAAVTAQGLFADGQSRDVTAEVDWSSGDATVIAGTGPVADGEAFTALAEGKTELRARFAELSATAAVAVLAPRVIPDPGATLTADGHAGEHAVPKGADVAVAWASTDASSCQLIAGDVVLEASNTSGTLAFKASDAATLKLTCTNDFGMSASDELQLSVTLPKATLTIGASSDPSSAIDLNAVAVGTNLTASWQSEAANTCRLLLDGSDAATGTGGEHAFVVAGAHTIRVECKDTAGNIASQQAGVKVTKSVAFNLPAGVADQVAGTTTLRPLAIYFALDISGSMQSNIAAIRNNIKAFVDELAKRKFAPRLGVIPFRDNVPRAGTNGDVPEGRFALSADVDAFKAFVSGLTATGGGDAQEASLLAIEESLRALGSEEARPDALKVILVITDNPGHHGVTPHNCSIAPTKAAFDALAATEQKLVKLFYATATGWPCGGYSSATGQLDALLASILPAEPELANRGRHIAFPFTAAALVTTFAALLTDVTPPLDLACVDEAVTVKLDGVAQFDWTATDRGAVYARYKSGTSLEIARVLSDAQIAAYRGGHLSADVQRCCVSKAAAEAGEFGSCLSRGTALDAEISL